MLCFEFETLPELSKRFELEINMHRQKMLYWKIEIFTRINKKCCVGYLKIYMNRPKVLFLKLEILPEPQKSVLFWKFKILNDSPIGIVLVI